MHMNSSLHTKRIRHKVFEFEDGTGVQLFCDECNSYAIKLTKVSIFGDPAIKFMCTNCNILGVMLDGNSVNLMGHFSLYCDACETYDVKLNIEGDDIVARCKYGHVAKAV